MKSSYIYNFGLVHEKVKRSGKNSPRHYEQFIGWKIKKDSFGNDLLDLESEIERTNEEINNEEIEK